MDDQESGAEEMVGVTGLEPVTPSLSSKHVDAEHPERMELWSELTDLLGHVLVHKGSELDVLQLSLELLASSSSAANPGLLIRSAVALLLGLGEGRDP